MLEQAETKLKTNELDHHFRELVVKGFTIVKEVDTEQIDGIYQFIGEQKEILDKSVFEDTFANGNIDFVGWRETKTKCFSTADQRNHRIIISPHCESNPRGGSFQVAFFYCKKPAEIGGDNILIPTENISDDLTFKKSIFIPAPRRLDDWRSFQGIMHHTFPFLKKIRNLSKPFLFLLFLLLFVNNIIPIILKILGTAFVVGSVTSNGLPIIRFSKFEKHLNLEKGLNGLNYRTLGFSEGFYDLNIRKKFSDFILKNKLYFAKVSELKLYINKSEEFRYKPLYYSLNDFSKLFNNSVILKLNKNELLIIDNRRYMHSSAQYEGERHMYASFL